MREADVPPPAVHQKVPRMLLIPETFRIYDVAWKRKNYGRNSMNLEQKWLLQKLEG